MAEISQLRFIVYFGCDGLTVKSSKVRGQMSCFAAGNLSE